MRSLLLPLFTQVVFISYGLSVFGCSMGFQSLEFPTQVVLPDFFSLSVANGVQTWDPSCPSHCIGRLSLVAGK